MTKDEKRQALEMLLHAEREIETLMNNHYGLLKTEDYRKAETILRKILYLSADIESNYKVKGE